jgi:NAD(P)-dependent dehydrogenase (short-subunit alcohol dehydrogenase family)
LRVVLLGRTAIDQPEPECVRALNTDADIKRALHADASARGRKLTPSELQREVNAITARREARASCAALRATGSEVRYHAVDTSDAAAVAAVVQQVRAEWGPVRGLVHAAGVLADKALHEKPNEQFLTVYRTKVEGFQALLAATPGDPLETIVCFSSVAARAGNAGQADYAAANEALNKLCQAEQHRRGPTCLVRAINWGPWDGGMVGAGLKAHFAARGIALIPRAAGAERFADIVTGAIATSVECVVGAAFDAPSISSRAGNGERHA